MCCRVFNTTNPRLPVTGRNMNWYNLLDTYLFLNPANIAKQGLSKAFANSQNICRQDIYSWTSKYASVSTIMSGVHKGNEPTSVKPYSCYEQACADGINEKGLVVNALADSFANYGAVKNNQKLLSSLRWSQYILDTFASVQDAIEGLKQPEYQIIDQGIPDSSNKLGSFHICLSDPVGDSAIIEYVDGYPIIHCAPQFRIATNQPGYDMQLVLNEYWRYQWGLSKVENKNVIHTAPGGHISTQMFEQASYNLSFCTAMSTQSLATAQTRSLMNASAVPIDFNKKKYIEENASHVYTTWINVAVHFGLRYYFINNLVGNGGYLELDSNLTVPMKVKVQAKEQDNQEQFESFNGNLASQLIEAEMTPFQQ